MFEDICEQKSDEQRIKELEKKLLDGYSIIQDASDEIKNLQDESLVMDRKYNQSYQDCRRLAGILAKEITKDRLDKICKEQDEVERILKDNNILDEDD